MLDEFVALFFNPVILVIVALTLVALLIKRRTLDWVFVALWSLLALTIGFDYYGPVLDDIRWAAMGEGCIGSPLLFVALAIAICATLILGALRPRN